MKRKPKDIPVTPVGSRYKRKPTNLPTRKKEIARIMAKYELQKQKLPSSRLLKDMPELFGQIVKDKHPYIEAENLSVCSIRKLWWKCSAHLTCDEHVYQSSVKNRAVMGSGCPFCLETSHRKYCRCDVSKTIAGHPVLSLEFDAKMNDGINPSQTSHGSMKIVWWKCSNHKTCDEHKWQTSACARTNGRGCPFCGSGMKRYCRCEFSSTIASNAVLVKEFDKQRNGDLDLSRIGLQSNRCFWWKCSISKDCPPWQNSPASRTSTKFVKAGCPSCSSTKSALELFHKIEFDDQKSFPECRHIAALRFDFYLPKYNLLIELDGAQHFAQNIFTPTAKAFEDLKLRDRKKEEFAKSKKIHLLRISYDQHAHIAKHIFDMLDEISRCPPTKSIQIFAGKAYTKMD